jgi:KTSC domain
VSRTLDIQKVDIALKRAARRAAHGTPEERSGRFLVSSTITSVEYDDEARELDVTFTSGKMYRYFNVPLEIYAEFLDAGSKGKFFNDNIKGVFAFAEVGQR